MSGNEEQGGDRQSGPEIGFSAAMQELESILRQIEAEEVDIDELAARLGRAAELLELCRGKIRKAEVEVNQIVQGLEPADGGDGEDGA